MHVMPKVLLVEDTLSLAATYKHYLSNEAIFLTHVDSGERAKQAIADLLPSLVLLDLKLPDMSGQEVLAWIREHEYPCSVVVMTAHSSVDVAVDVMRLGAQDFLEKPFDAARLRTTVMNALKQHRLNHIVAEIQSTARTNYHGFIGSSLEMQAVYRIIDAAAPSKATVFITGESGTGKEVCAEAIHKQSPRKNKPFIALNCGAIPRDLMESEVFGHVKGSFTGASSERQGAASLADGGTLFLDEIGEMDLDLQTKLLRFVQTGVVQKVGGSKAEQVDVRFICATNKEPLAEVAAGRFREDLYYRLHVVPIALPPLRERGDDIIRIAEAFLEQFSQEESKNFKDLSQPVIERLLDYPWPGNIRQLQNIIRNVVVLNDGESVSLEHLPPPLNQATPQKAAETKPKAAPSQSIPAPREQTSTRVAEAATLLDMPVRPLAEVERDTIEHAINLCDGNIPKAAALLAVSPSTIYRKKMVWDQGE
ncbi:sigma-54-dependent transcriptional regulator [Motilimonas eburnea]|uniref:sigma-54-dependent transcriptional regulator n=1 Tax=Motilimonas eburnea TaxID=1737488 RepID=UPI001E547F5D|nr:sigma-54 dependent transcriptional regulator [Motilimonas eburnea]MCE2570762.1 sigma-54 dependent transcriptional regulator [Motilimonas eburnea]